MKRAVFAVVLAMFAFYVAWPTWTGYRIRQAFNNQDEALLESKVDFPSVREAMKPAVRAEIERTVEATRRDGGALASIIAGQIRGDTAGRLADSAINAVMTPKNLIRIVREGRDVKQAVERVLYEQLGLRRPGDSGPRSGLGGVVERLGQRRQGTAEPAPTAPTPPEPATGETTPRRFGLSNLQRVAPLGPLSFEVAAARDPAASEPDIIAELRFTSGDWKVVRIIPRLQRRTAASQ